MLKKIGKRLKDQRGLTLVELLAVVVILGIISAIAVPSIGGIIQKSKEDAVKADAIQILNAAKIYVSSSGIPGSGELLKAELDSYYEGGKVTLDKVTVSKDAKPVFALFGTGDAGSVTITFSDATLDEINADKGKGTRTIGK